MRRNPLQMFGVVSGVAAAALALVVLASPSPVRAAEAPPPDGYVGADTCKGCHDDVYARFETTRMGRLFLKHPRNTVERTACETCHGPGKAHVESGGKNFDGFITFEKNDPTPVEKRNAVCLGCHQKGDRLFWQGSPHEARDVACTNCHKIMQGVSAKNQLAKETVVETCGQCHLQKRAQLMRSSHMPLREGKMTCTSCHNPHGTVTPTLLKENSINETCYTCHAEKRGPFLWTHVPVQESCDNCHEPHGTNHVKMLKVPVPRLCQRCHQPGPHGSFASGKGDQSTSRFTMGRGCVQCHQIIHGSNHPAGQFFQR